MKRRSTVRKSIVLMVLISFLSGCGIFDKILNTGTDIKTETLNTLNDAITALQSQSADWQQVLKETVNKLSKDAQSTLRAEVSNLLSRTVAQGGVELRCDADFIRARIREELVRLKAKFMGQPEPVVDPAFCQVVPIAVDRELIPDRLKQVEFYGYNFDQAGGLGVFVEGAGGQRINITDKLDKPTTYAMTLKFGASGVQLDNASARLVLEWGGKQISTVAVIQPTTPVCASKVQVVSPGSIGPFVPRKIGQGDADFAGNGPDVNADVSLIVAPQALSARVHMHARETRSDWTEVDGWQTYQLYAPDPGWRIEQVIGKTSSVHHYVDSNVTEDSFDQGTGELVRRYVYVGDTAGDEAGTRTSVKVTFNDIHLVLVQTSNCVPDTAIKTLQFAGLLSTRASTRLNSAALTQVEKRKTMMLVLPHQ
jgi:hypothetical protein